MKFPVWFGPRPSNAAVQRGMPTPAQAEGLTLPGVPTQEQPIILAGPMPPGTFPWLSSANNDVIQRGAPEIDGRMARRTSMWNVPISPPRGPGNYHTLRTYDWGAAGFGYMPSQITTNPIGGGQFANLRVGQATREPGQVAQVANNTFVWYSLQMQNWGIQPGNSPIYAPDILRQLMGPLASAAALPNPM